ncbi:MAG: hypothetical protein WB799_01980 [Candidatus Sulfotelmatobacter sp.]
MISSSFADIVLFASLLVSVGAYAFVSKREGSYLNILTPTFIISIPGYYLLPLFFTHVFGTEASPYAFIYIYATLAVENVVFAYVYTRPTRKLIRLPFRYSYSNFDVLSFSLLGLAVLMYAPVLLQFPEYLLDPRQIYAHTRTGFGINFYISTTLAYLSVILIQFTDRSRWVKRFVILVAAVLISFHGSKGQILSLVLLVALFQVYVSGRKLKFWPSLLAGIALGFFLLLLFAATMALGDSPAGMLEDISQYSDYTRNAMLVIDSHFPLQYGRLTMEAATIGRIPRFFLPNKPKNFGALYLDDQFFPESVDADAGAPDFGIGVQYADFGALAIIYLAIFAMFRGWLARIFVDRLKKSRHPADFFLVAFLAEISLFPVGGVGWLLPEALVVAAFLCFVSRVGAGNVYRERIVPKAHFGSQSLGPSNSAESV